MRTHVKGCCNINVPENIALIPFVFKSIDRVDHFEQKLIRESLPT